MAKKVKIIKADSFPIPPDYILKNSFIDENGAWQLKFKGSEIKKLMKKWQRVKNL